MSFTDIELDKTVIAELYKNNLVQITNMKSQKPPETSLISPDSSINSLQYLGKNLKNILVFVNYEVEKFLPGAEQEFLEKILAACSLNIDDIAVVNTANQPLSLDEYIKILHPRSILAFGTHADITGEFSTIDFFNTAYLQGIAVIKAPALEKLRENNTESIQLKNRLWQSLKQFFNLKNG